MRLACFDPRACRWNVILRIGNSAQNLSMIVLLINIDVSCTPNCGFWIGTDRQKHVLIIVVSEIPISFTNAILLSPLADAIITTVKGITVLIDFLDTWQVPHTDHTLTTPSKEYFFQLRI
jgi:hypothetical protein